MVEPNLLQQLKNQNNEDKEPSLRIGISSGTVAGIVTLILYIAPNIPDIYMRIILVLIVVGVPILSAILIRKKVWSPYSMNEIVDIVTMLAKNGPAMKTRSSILNKNKESK